MQGLQGSLWGPPLSATPRKQPLWPGDPRESQGIQCSNSLEGHILRVGRSEGPFISQIFYSGGRVEAGGVWPQESKAEGARKSAFALNFWVLPLSVSRAESLGHLLLLAHQDQLPRLALILVKMNVQGLTFPGPPLFSIHSISFACPGTFPQLLCHSCPGGHLQLEGWSSEPFQRPDVCLLARHPSLAQLHQPAVVPTCVEPPYRTSFVHAWTSQGSVQTYTYTLPA